MMIMTGIATKMSSAISAFVRNAMTTGTDEHDRGHDRHGDEHLQESFDLLDIVGVTQ